MIDASIIFIGSTYARPITGGQIYNAIVTDYLLENQPGFARLAYPWRSFITNFLFDLNIAVQLAFTGRRRTIIFDESMHQRMPLTLLASILLPWNRFILMMHQLAFTRHSNRFHRSFTRYVDALMIRHGWRAISAGLQITDLASDLAGPKHAHKIKTVLATPQSAIEDDREKGEFSILFAGSITPAKGVHYLVDAIALLDPLLRDRVKVTVIGRVDNQEYAELCKKAAESQAVSERLQWIDYLPFPELAQKYKVATVFLFPSVSESMGMALLEAMSAGCVPIAFDNTAMPYLITDGVNGMLAKNLDAASMARKLQQFYSLNADERRAMRTAASATAAKYTRSWTAVAEEFRRYVCESDVKK